jgi:predicted aspartyl protease
MIDEPVVIGLLQKGGIKRSDFEGEFEQIVRNDRIKEGTVVTLRRIRLGETTVEDVRCRVRKDNGDLLTIGGDMLRKAGSYKIDKEKQVLIFN